MHIILVSNRLETIKRLAITPRTVVVAVAGLVAAVFALSSLFSYLAVRHVDDVPLLREVAHEGQLAAEARRRAFMEASLKAMAARVGELQMRLEQLDSLGGRLATAVGAKAQASAIKTSASVRQASAIAVGGLGGPLIKPESLSETELQQALDALSAQTELRSDTFAVLDARLFEERPSTKMLLTTLPVDAEWSNSGFGWRLDPVTSERAMHEGVDFPANVGTRIVAPAPGIVVAAGFRQDYGNVIEIDHGNDLTTRYAHTSRVFVKVGSVVKRGQAIAEVGNTGRSTGPHLHFEVRYRGIAQNPARYLKPAQGPRLQFARQ